jgi:hypothetical protein
MYTLRIKKVVNGVYATSSKSDKQIEVLGEFLCEDILGILADHALNCLLTDGYYIANACHSRLKKNIVTIKALYDDEMLPYCIPFDKLVKLIDAWVKIYDDLPEYITITIDDKYNFEITYNTKSEK